MHTDLTPTECKEFLAANHYGHLGCSDGAEPYVVPITYKYKDGVIYNATNEGRKVEIMRGNPRVCLQVEKLTDAGTWKSVMCWGTAEEVTDADAAQDIKLLLAEEYGDELITTKKAIVSPVMEELHDQPAKNTEVMMRITVDRMTGRSSATY